MARVIKFFKEGSTKVLEKLVEYPFEASIEETGPACVKKGSERRSNANAF